jgi:DnaJ-class molecular chaperone
MRGEMSEPFRDCYQTLGVEPAATAEEIRRAWRRLAKRLHPDRNPGDPLCEQRFKQAQEAYHTLADAALRARHDELLARRARRNPSAAEGARPAEPRRPEAPRPQAGQDRRQILHLPLERFEGGGRVNLTRPGQAALELVLPARIVPGDELALAGQGHPGRHGGASGRLILEIRPQLPEGVRLEGADLVCELEADALLLMTGGPVALRHPAGRALELQLPAGAQPGQRLRLRGQGLPARQGRGDLVLELRARLRPAASARARRLAEKLRRLLDDEEERG